MLKWISSTVQEIRIKVDFLRFQKVHLNEFVVDAYDKMDSMVLEQALFDLKARVLSDTDALFSPDYEYLSREINSLQPTLTRATTLLGLFQRDFPAELNALYIQKSALYEKHRKMQLEKSQAYAAIQSSHDEKYDLDRQRGSNQTEIEDWYVKSKRTPWLLGTKNRKIPQRSPFRTSHGDLEASKSDRQRVYDELNIVREQMDDDYQSIGRIKNALQANLAALHQLKLRILRVKEDRTQYYKLKKSGTNLVGLQADADSLRRQITLAKNAEAALKNRRDKYLTHTEQSNGVPA